MKKFICLVALFVVTAPSYACKLVAQPALTGKAATSPVLSYGISVDGRLRASVSLPTGLDYQSCRITLQSRLRNNGTTGRAQRLKSKYAEGANTTFRADGLPAVVNLSKQRASVLYLRAVVDCGTEMTSNTVGHYLDCGRGPSVTATKFMTSLRRKIE